MPTRSHSRPPLPHTGQLRTSLTPAQQWLVEDQWRRIASHEDAMDTALTNRVETWADRLNGTVRNVFGSTMPGRVRWDAGEVSRTRLDRQLAGAAYQSLDDFGDEVALDAEEQVERSYRDGFLAGLWYRYRTHQLNDVDLETLPLDAPEKKDSDAWLLAAAIGGLAIGARVRRWIGDAKVSMRSALTYATLGEQALQDTEASIDRIADVTESRLSILTRNEVARGFDAGMLLSAARLGQRGAGMTAIWWTRLDPRVCAYCASLHGVITTLIPIDDSHPGCRCRRVSVWNLDSALFDTTPISYEDFLALYEEARS